jgi:hypothetical protein
VSEQPTPLTADELLDVFGTLPPGDPATSFMLWAKNVWLAKERVFATFDERDATIAALRTQLEQAQQVIRGYELAAEEDASFACCGGIWDAGGCCRMHRAECGGQL